MTQEFWKGNPHYLKVDLLALGRGGPLARSLTYPSGLRKEIKACLHLEVILLFTVCVRGECVHCGTGVGYQGYFHIASRSLVYCSYARPAAGDFPVSAPTSSQKHGSMGDYYHLCVFE